MPQEGSGKMKVVMVSINDRGNIGARQLVAKTILAGHEAKLINVGEYNHQKYTISDEHPNEPTGAKFKEILAKLNPDVVGISYRSAFAYMCPWIAGMAKELFPGCLMLAGGIGAISEPEKALEWADVVCTGEGDNVWLPLITSARPLETTHQRILNTMTKYGKSEMAPLLANLDEMPAPHFEGNNIWSICAGYVTHPDGRLDNELGAYPLLTSRGCPRACTYCSNSTLHPLYKGQKYCRQRSVQNVMEELHWAINTWDVKLLSIYDDLFVADPDWIFEFCRRFAQLWPKNRMGREQVIWSGPEVRYREEPRPPRFWCMTHPHYVQEDVIRALVDVGLEEICLGVQTGSERILKMYNRPTTIDEILRACDVLSKFKLGVKIDIISANPDETIEDIQATLNLVKRMPLNKLWHSGVSRLTIFPGAKIAEKFTQAQCEALHGDRQDFIDGIYRAAFEPQWRGRDLASAVARYDDFQKFKASRKWSNNPWEPLTAWIDARFP
jgi:anaerobic magnesium-protoporphyrin IX monomethyl ester cyclase